METVDHVDMQIISLNFFENLQNNTKN